MLNKKVSPDTTYKELGNNYRFFLTWRHALYAGFFVVIGFVLINTYKAFTTAPNIGCFIPLIGTFISYIFWKIDQRTRALYQAAIKSGKDMEGDNGGFYTSVLKEPKSMPHSTAIDITYGVSGIFLLLLFIGLTIYAFCYSG